VGKRIFAPELDHPSIQANVPLRDLLRRIIEFAQRQPDLPGDVTNILADTSAGALPLTTKGDLLTRDDQGNIRLAGPTIDGRVLKWLGSEPGGLVWGDVLLDVLKAGSLAGSGLKVNFTQSGGATVAVVSDAGNGWITIDIGAATLLDVLKAGVLIGSRQKINFYEDGNVALTITDNPGAGWVDIGVKAIPGSSIPPYTALWAWNKADLTQFAIAYTGGGGPWVVGDATAYNNTDNSAGSPLYEHLPHFKFFNPVGTAANVFFLYSSSSMIAATGELLLVEVDYYNAAANTTGIIIGKPGSETTDNYRLLDNNSAIQLHKAVAGVGEVLQADAVATPDYQGHGWHRIRLIVNTSAGSIGGIPAGGMIVYQGSIPVLKKTMKVTNATVLSGAVTIGVRFLGNAGLGNVYGYVSRLAAYSVGADIEQFF